MKLMIFFMNESVRSQLIRPWRLFLKDKIATGNIVSISLNITLLLMW